MENNDIIEMGENRDNDPTYHSFGSKAKARSEKYAKQMETYKSAGAPKPKGMGNDKEPPRNDKEPPRNDKEPPRNDKEPPQVGGDDKPAHVKRAERRGADGYHAMGGGTKSIADREADRIAEGWEPAREGSGFQKKKAKKKKKQKDREDHVNGKIDEALINQLINRIEELERKLGGISSNNPLALEVIHGFDSIILDPVNHSSGGAVGGSSSMFYPSTSTANEISVTAGVCVVGLTSYDISALSDEAVSDGEWLILKVDMRDPAVTPVYEVVSNPYPIVSETYFKYIKIARFNGDGDFQRAHNGGLLEVDFT